MRKYRVLKGVKIVAVVALGIGLFGFVVERLWNWLVPSIFGWKPITFVQALGLLVLSKILFGGLHRHGGRRGWKRGMRERWAQMSAADRERVRAGLRARGGCGWDRGKGMANEEVAQ